MALQSLTYGLESKPIRGVLVLRNGNVFSGLIVRDERGFGVTLTAGGHIYVAADRVEMCCRDMEDAYRRKAAGLHQANATEHLDLVQWCLQHKLYRYAADHLLQGMVLDPNNPRIHPLQQQLVAATQPPEHTPPQTPPINKKTWLPLADLEREAEALPSNTVHDFAQRVQPLLLNRCASTTCHGTASTSKFRLQRPPWGGQTPRPLALRNLHATLKYVNRQTPKKSRLLTIPQAAHGTARGPVFLPQHKAQLDQLEKWAYSVANQSKPSPTTPAATPSTTPPAKLSAAATATSRPIPHKQPKTATRSNLAQTSGIMPTRSPVRPNDRRTRLPEGLRDPKRNPKKAVPPKDPFDPNIFNQRYLPSRNTHP